MDGNQWTFFAGMLGGVILVFVVAMASAPKKPYAVRPHADLGPSMYLEWLEKRCAGVSGPCVTLYQDALERESAFTRCFAACEGDRACAEACVKQ